MQPVSGAAWTQVAGALAMFDGAASPLTQTFGLGIFEAVTNQHLDEIEHFFRERGAPVVHELNPLADASLFGLLNERGYQPVEFTSVMFRSLESKNEYGAAINPNIKMRIVTADEAKLWAQTSAEGWSTEMPGLKGFMYGFGHTSAHSMVSFIAEIDHQPVATGAMFISRDTALLAGASTVPAGRRQGAQLALLDARLRFAAAHSSQLQRNGRKTTSASLTRGASGD